MNQKNSFIIWGAWYGSGNLGDKALLFAITDLIGRQPIDNLKFIIPTANPDIVKGYLQAKPGVEYQVLHSRNQFFEFIQSFSKARGFIVGGGVPFYDDPSHSLAIATITLLSAVVRVPIILWSVSSQRVNSLFTRLVLRFLISRCAVLTCRDRSTLGLLASCGADPAHLQIVPDPVFAMDFEDERAGRQVLERAGWQSGGQERELIAFTPRTFRGRDGEAHTHYKPQTQSSYKKQIGVYAAVLDWAWENGYQPVFVPMNTVGADDDCIASKEIMQQAKYGRHALLIHENIHPRVVKGIYAQCKTGLVTRVHGAITSYISGCPVAMYAFDQKHFGVMELMKANQMIFDPAQQDAGDAIAILQKILGDHAGIVKKMQEDLVDLQARAGIPIQLLMQMHRRT